MWNLDKDHVHAHDARVTEIFRMLDSILSHDVASDSDITTCNKIDAFVTLRNDVHYDDKIFESFSRQNAIFMSCDKYNLTTRCEIEIKCSTRLAFYLFSSTNLINSIKH